MKKLLPFLLALGLRSFAFAGEDWQAQPIGPFGTLNNRDSSFAIPSEKAQDLLNVNITPGGKSVFKRDGYGSVFSLTFTSSPVHGVYNFFDSSGNDISLFFNDTYLTSSTGGNTPYVLFSTGPSGATYQCTDSLGYAYCANTERNTLTKTNGAIAQSIRTVSSTGTMVATAVTRLAMAGFSDAPSRIDFSADSDFSSWGSGSLGTSPAQFTINAPGAKITHITYAFGRLMWFKDTSFGYILIGKQPYQSDWVIKTVAYDVGTNDNTSVFREGVLYFRGKEGHIYAFDGSNYQLITDEISGTISQSQPRVANTWTQSTSAEFGTGSFNYDFYLDTLTVSGSMQLTFPDEFGSYRDGSNSTKPVWKTIYTGASTGTISGGVSGLVIRSTGGALGRVTASTIKTINDFQPGTTISLTLSRLSPDAVGDLVEFYVVLTTQSPTTTNPDSMGSNFYLVFTSTFQPTSTFGYDPYCYLSEISNSSDGVLYSSGTTAVSFRNVLIDFYIATTTWQVKVYKYDDKSVIYLSTGGTHSWPTGQLFVNLSYKNGVSGAASPYEAVIADFNVYPQTGTFISAVNPAPSFSSWSSFNVTSQNGGGSHSFYVRSASNSFTLGSSTPSWTAINSGDVPSLPYGNFMQFKDDLSVFIDTTSPSFSDFSFNWYEGSASDKAYATYFDDKIWWAVTSGAGSTSNNKILLYDLLNSGWLIYDLASNGFLVRNNSLYFGSSAGGYIYKFGDSTSDNGSAINSYWKSKDFFGASPFSNQELANISISAESVSNSSMTVTYTTDGDTEGSYTMPLYNPNGLFRNMNKNLPAGVIGYNYNVKFGNNAADQPFEVFAVQVGIRPRSWIPKQ